MIALLKDHFYIMDSLQSDADKISAQITFNAGHHIFKGHFPDMPIVPGVCQTQILSEILNQALNSNLQLKSATSIKFLSIVNPRKNQSINLQIAFTYTDDLYNVSAQYKWEDVVFFKFRGKFAAT